MLRRLSTRELKDLGLAALGIHVEVDHLLNALQGEVSAAGQGIRIAGRAAPIASLGNLDEANARVLLMAWAQPAIPWTAPNNLGLGQSGGTRSAELIPLAEIGGVRFQELLLGPMGTAPSLTSRSLGWPSGKRSDSGNPTLSLSARNCWYQSGYTTYGIPTAQWPTRKPKM